MGKHKVQPIGRKLPCLPIYLCRWVVIFSQAIKQRFVLLAHAEVVVLQWFWQQLLQSFQRRSTARSGRCAFAGCGPSGRLLLAALGPFRVL